MLVLEPEKFQLQLPDAELLYEPNFLGESLASKLYKEFLDKTPWQQDLITLFGKTHPQPRLTALYSQNSELYSYSGIEMQPHAFTGTIQNLNRKVEIMAKHSFTSVLLNLYRDGKDSNGWHADNEKELGNNPVIASLSLGEERYFHFKHQTKKELSYKLLLKHGSLLIMQGAMQHYWLHQIPKTKRKIGSRINLTFRTLK